MALHVKSFRIKLGENVLHVDLQVDRPAPGEVGLKVRISKQKVKGREVSLGIAFLNKAGELVHASEDLADNERTAIEVAIAEAL